MSVDLASATVLLTGATGGLGQAIARELARRGASLVLTGRRGDVLAPLAAELGARSLVVDLTDPAAVDRLAREAGAVDVLIANAGLPGGGALESFDVEGIDLALDVNLRAPIVLAHALVPGMVERGRGHVVFMSSLSGKIPAPVSALYSATKYGLRGFALGLRADLGGTGVGVSTIFPGFIRDAGMFHDSGAELPPGLGTKSPDDVAKAVVRAIRRGRAEVDVAPLPQRAGALIAGVAPGLVASVTGRFGGGISERVTSGNAHKR
jgi:short-subunit dehydrogenase